ncbi:MAG TPA: FAD-dependent monooxygenase [Gaiellaceae bacterium]|nr:FAD-dependent monooxygenase [Gaiellaceae bacterium]
MKTIVVGAGIGGLAVAAGLVEAGVETVVVERAQPSDRAGAGIALGPNALAALEHLGALERVLAYGNTSAGRMILDRRGRKLTEGPWHGAVVRRTDLYAALVQRLGTDIRYGTRCVGFDESDEGVEAQLDEGPPERGDLLVGADGLRSFVRSRLFGDGDPVYRGATSWRGIAEFAHPLMAERIAESWGCGLRIGLQNLGRGWTYWFVARNAPAGTRLLGAEAKDQLLEWFRGWHEPVEAVLAATDPAEILQTDLYDRDPLPRWSTGRVTLLGDAAHPMTPDLGQGASQAIEDAVALAECARAATSVSDLLRAYEERRREAAYGVMRRARRHFRISHLPSPTACRVRNATVKRLPSVIQLALGVRRPAWGGGRPR